jgi:signal transduction histidine kinase
VRATYGTALGELADELRATGDELDGLARGLHPRVLTGNGLAATLERLCERAETPVDALVCTERLAPVDRVRLVLVCSEALTNIANTHATRVLLDVTQTDGTVIATITDDGIGDADRAKGTGLRGLADRIEALGVHLVLESNALSGTRLVVRLPVVSGQ